MIQINNNNNNNNFGKYQDLPKTYTCSTISSESCLEELDSLESILNNRAKTKNNKDIKKKQKKHFPTS